MLPSCISYILSLGFAHKSSSVTVRRNIVLTHGLCMCVNCNIALRDLSVQHFLFEGKFGNLLYYNP